MRSDIITYIDITDDEVDNFVQFYPKNVEAFKNKREPNQFFKRKGWGKIVIANDPVLYASTSQDIYRLYDLILAADFTFEIKVLFHTDLFDIYGYFGVNDCEIDTDREIITVTPAIQDRYTDVLENWETKIDFSDIVISDDEIDLNIAALGTKTRVDWEEIVDLTGIYEMFGIEITQRPAPLVKINAVTWISTMSASLAAFFDGQAPNRTLVAVPPTNFADYEGFYLADREEILGEDFSSATYETWLSIDTYAKFDTSQATSDVVTHLGITYKSIQAGNLNNTPASSPLWWEDVGVGGIYPDKGDWELSEYTVWQGREEVGLFPGQEMKIFCTTKFSRDEFLKVDEDDGGGGLVPPSGSGWNLRTKILVEGQDGHLWTRRPFNAAFKDEWVLQDEETNPSAEGSSDFFTWFNKRTTKIFYPNSDDSKTMTSSIEPREFFDHVFQNTNEVFADKNVFSTFFFNDLEAELPILADRIGEGLNYVTMSENYLNDTAFFFTRDFIPDLDPADTSSFPDVTLKKFLEDLNKLFKNNLYWFVDDSGDLRIEHIKYLDLTRSAIDLRGEEELDFTESYKFDKSKMFNRIELRQVNASGVDFTDNLILFDKIVSNKRNIDIKLELETSIFSTDLRHVVENSTDLENGILFVALKTEQLPTVTITVRNKVGAVSGVSQSNGFMALANLLLDFGRYEGVWDEGTINGSNVTFVTTARTKKGKELKLKGALDSLFYVTELGIGLLDNSTIDFESENTTLNLSYRYNAIPTTERFALMIQKESDFEGADEIWFNFANYNT